MISSLYNVIVDPTLTTYLSPVAVITLIVFMLWRDGLISFKRNSSGGVTGLARRMDTLSNYYNHETTEILTDIRDGVNAMNLKLDLMQQNGIRCSNRQ